MVGFLITNGGAHPPKDWAEMTAQHIVDVIQIEPSSPVFDAANAAKENLKKSLAEHLHDHHADVQDSEKENLTKNGLSQEIKVDHHLEDVVQTVLDCVKGTMFESHFHKSEVVTFVASTLLSHFHTVAQIERQWHAAKQGE